MERIKISVPASTSNLGPGFDYLGMSLNLYNEFIFTRSEKIELLGFSNLKNNLVLESYLHLFKKLNKEIIPVKIEWTKKDIPTSRGLGSSASAIIAGVLASSYFINHTTSISDYLINEMIELEGHRDNLIAELYGSLVSSIIDDGKCIVYHHIVNPKLKFLVLIPKYEVSTKMAREALPKTLSYSDLTFNASRALNLVQAFKDGSIEDLKIVLKDNIHEKYRKEFIKEYNDALNITSKYNAILKISGSGSSMLVITTSISSLKDELSSLDLDVIEVNTSKDVSVHLEVLDK